MATKIPLYVFLALALAMPGLAGVRAQQASPSKADEVRNRAPAAEHTTTHRKKRGGPQSKNDEKDATPAEGQNDLIKVLQPGSRQKTNQ